MAKSEKLDAVTVSQEIVRDVGHSISNADNILLAKLGYKSEFKREFSVNVLLESRSHDD